LPLTEKDELRQLGLEIAVRINPYLIRAHL